MNVTLYKIRDRLVTLSVIVLAGSLGMFLFEQINLGLVGLIVGLTLGIGFYEEFFRAVGAASIAYHECIRGRRTAICTECGELWDAEIRQCPDCGGECEENMHPEELD